MLKSIEKNRKQTICTLHIILQHLILDYFLRFVLDKVEQNNSKNGM